LLPGVLIKTQRLLKPNCLSLILAMVRIKKIAVQFVLYVRRIETDIRRGGMIKRR